MDLCDRTPIYFCLVLCHKPQLLVVYFIGEALSDRIAFFLSDLCVDQSQLSGQDLWLPLTGQSIPGLLLPRQEICNPGGKLFLQHGVSLVVIFLCLFA